MKKLNFILICLLGLSILSCSSDTENLTDDDPNGGNNGNVTTEKYIKKRITDHGEGFIQTGEYTYRENNSLETIKYYYPNDTLELSFFYDNNRLSRIEYDHVKYELSYSGTLYYSYNNDQLVKMEHYEYPNYFASKNVYTITDNKITSLVNYDYSSSYDDERTFTYDANGNFATVASANSSRTLTYDDKNHPYKNLNLIPTIYLFSGGRVILYISSMKNNVISSSNGNVDEDINYSYVYDEDGYPTTGIREANGNIITTTYEYY